MGRSHRSGRRLPAGLLAVLAAVGLAVVPAGVASAGAGEHALPSWQLTPTGSTEQFRGLAAVSTRVAWVAGSGGTVLRTVDGGRSWQDVSPAGAQALQFRDIEA